MFPKTLIYYCIFSSVFCYFLTTAYEVKFEQVQKSALNIQQRSGRFITYANNTNHFRIPKDDGVSNYGDLVHLQMSYDDDLGFQQVYINKLEKYEQIIQWSITIVGFRITHIQFLNFGRQRAFTNSIWSSTSRAQAVITVPANTQCRMYIAVYGRPLKF